MLDMTRPKPLTRRQLAVLDELLADVPDDKTVLDRYKIDPELYNKWLTEPAFIEQFDKRIAAAHRRSVLHLARFATKAAARLVQLSEKGEGETARKACLDIISGCDSAPAADRKREAGDDAPQTSEHLSPETASRILTTLADEARGKQCTVKGCAPDATGAGAVIPKPGAESITNQAGTTSPQIRT